MMLPQSPLHTCQLAHLQCISRLRRGGWVQHQTAFGGSALTTAPRQLQPVPVQWESAETKLEKGWVRRGSVMEKLKMLGISPRVCAKSIKCHQRGSRKTRAGQASLTRSESPGGREFQLWKCCVFYKGPRSCLVLVVCYFLRPLPTLFPHL